MIMGIFIVDFVICFLFIIELFFVFYNLMFKYSFFFFEWMDGVNIYILINEKFYMVYINYLCFNKDINDD